ncbi:MAG: hypothetical protein U9R56_06415 [candidate division Zixibacteria bacterium]|nr:hypothetical protein [candidate division Zixibacteria bacterium]
MIVSLLVFSGGVRAFDFTTGCAEGLGETVLLSRSSASEFLVVPCGSITSGEGKVEAGFRRMYEMKELDDLFFAAAYRSGKFTLGLGLTQFGDPDLYTEKTGRLMLACHLGRWTTGLFLSGMLVQFGQYYEGLSASTLGGGLSYRTERIIGAVTCDNMTSPCFDENSPRLNPKYSIWTELIGPGPYSLTGRVILEKTEKPRFALGQKIDLSTRASFFWGIVTAPIKYGGGLQLNLDRYAIICTTSYHPELGLTPGLALSVNFGSISKTVRKE